MQAGNLVKTKCFGPSTNTVGELGVLVRPCITGVGWIVFFAGTGKNHLIARDGLELVDESR